MRTKKIEFNAAIENHLGAKTADSPIVRHVFEVFERPNLHLAIEELLESQKNNLVLLGIVERDYGASLARLSSESSSKDFETGPVEYLDIELSGNQHLACVKTGLYLFDDDGASLVMLICKEPDTYPPKILVEVMAGKKDAAQKFISKLVRMTKFGKAYRGKVFSLEQDCYGKMSVKFHRLPSIDRNQIVLPNDLLQRVERHTFNFSAHVDKLRSARRHIKRGMLLHGPPGTGKTLLAMYVASKMEGRTVLMLTGAGMGSIEPACNLARMLQPSTVILEDVDLIGTQRHQQTIGANALLFELLNQMDGFSEDSDVLFVLTTNRPDILEPALAARPGRIDQALEVPLPDKECRKRLFELYSDGLTLQVNNLDAMIERTEGVSAAFIREVLRKSAVIAAEESKDDSITVTETHLNDALSELSLAGGKLTRSLLGAAELE